MVPPRRVTSTQAKQHLRDVLDHAADGGTVIIVTTKAHHRRAVIIGVREAEEAGIIEREPK